MVSSSTVGADPDLAPTTHYRRAAGSRAWADLIAAAHAAYLTGDASGLVAWYADDALAEINVPDVIVLMLAGAATCGYGVMGLFELRSRNWMETRLPVFMAMVFNGAAPLATW